MQTQTQIRRMLIEAGLAPNRALGQNFLVDLNLLGKLLELAKVGREDTVLEVGPGTGSLTEELVERAGRVVAVEIDRGLHALLSGRLAGRDNVTLLHADALAGKHAISPTVIEALGPRAALVSNLPYNVATPLVAECLLMSHRAMGRLGRFSDPSAALSPGQCLFESLTFTVQREVADRMVAPPGDRAYGPLSVVVAILAKVTPGPAVPATAFWPQPNVASRILRIDFDAASAGRLADPDALTRLLWSAFAQRRKQIGSLLGRKDCPFEPDALSAAMDRAGIERKSRAEEVSPSQYLEAASTLSGKPS